MPIVRGATRDRQFCSQSQEHQSRRYPRLYRPRTKGPERHNDVYYDPVAAYAIALQLLPKTDDFAPDRTDKLRKLLNLTLAQAGSAAAKVQAALNDSQAADPEGGESPRLRDQAVGRVLSATAEQRFVDARELTKSIGDVLVSSQVNTLIDFAHYRKLVPRG